MKMEPEDYEREKARVERFIEKWASDLGLGWWRVEYRWHDEPCEDDKAGESTSMQTTSRWEYRWAAIDIYLPSCVGAADSEVEHWLVHEYAHVLLSVEQRQLSWKQHGQFGEAATENVARALLWTREAGAPRGE